MTIGQQFVRYCIKVTTRLTAVKLCDVRNSFVPYDMNIELFPVRAIRPCAQLSNIRLVDLSFLDTKFELVTWLTHSSKEEKAMQLLCPSRL
jgi:hypothetical protein